MCDLFLQWTASQGVVGELRSDDPRAEQLRDELVLDALRKQRELPIAEPRPVEHHRHGCRAYPHPLPVGRILGILPPRDANLPADFGHDAQMIQVLHHKLGRQLLAPFRSMASTLSLSSILVNPNCEMWGIGLSTLGSP